MKNQPSLESPTIIYNQREKELEEQRSAMIHALAGLMHEKWREARFDERTKTFTPRIKPVKDEDWIAANDGIKEIDIANTLFENLPKDWQEENYLSAKEAIEKIEEALYIIHDKWLDRNDEYAQAEQKAQYSRLPAAEKAKDVAVLEEAITIIKNGLR